MPNDDELGLHYDCLIADAVKDLVIYVQSNGLDDLKHRFRSTLTDDKVRRKAKNPRDLLESLEKHGKLGLHNTKLLRVLAEQLQLKDLEEKVYEYDLHSSGAFRRFKGKVWGLCTGGAHAVINLKTVLQTTQGKLALAVAVLYGLFNINPEILQLIQNVLPVAMKIIGAKEGSICFMIKTSCLSSLRQLWESYVNGSLRENLEKVFNGIPEIKELSNGEEIHVEVMLDEKEYSQACWDLIISQVKDNSVQEKSKASLPRQRRHSISCSDDLPAGEILVTCQEWMEMKGKDNQLMNETRKRKQAEDQMEEQQQEHKKKMQKMEEEVNEVEKKNMELKQEVAQLKTDLQASGEIIEKCLKPLENCEPREMLSQLSGDLLSKLPESGLLLDKMLSFVIKQIVETSQQEADVLLQVMQQQVELLSKLDWFYFGKDDRANLVSGIEERMALVFQQWMKYPQVSPDVLLQVMQQHVELLSKLDWLYFGKDDRANLVSGIEERMALVFQQWLKDPQVSPDVLLQVMQQHVELLSKLNWSSLDKDVTTNLAAGVEYRMASVTQQLLKDPQASPDVLLQVMQQHVELLSKLNWSSLDKDVTANLAAGVEYRMASVTQQWLKDPQVSPDVLLQVMQQHVELLSKLNWSSLDKDVTANLAAGVEYRMASVTQQWLKDPQVSPDVLLQVMQQHVELLSKLNWSNLDKDVSANLASAIDKRMASVFQQWMKNPQVSPDVVLQLVQQHLELLSKMNWSSLDKDVASNLASAIDKRIASVLQQLLKDPQVSPDVLLQVMQQHVELLSTGKLNWSSLDKDVSANLASGIDKRMASVIQQWLKDPQVSPDVLLQVMQQHVELLSKLNWSSLDKDVSANLASGIDKRMASVIQQWLKDPQVRPDVLLQVIDVQTKLLTDLYLKCKYCSGNDSCKKLASSIEENVTKLNQAFLTHPDLSPDVLSRMMEKFLIVYDSPLDDESKKQLISSLDKMMVSMSKQLQECTDVDIHDVFKISTKIFEKVSWSDFQEDGKIKVLSCLGLSMEILIQRLPESYDNSDFLSDVVCMILAMSSQLPSSSDITSQMKSHLEALVTAFGQTLSEHYDMWWTVRHLLEDIFRKLPEKAMSAEVVAMLLSIANGVLIACYRVKGEEVFMRQVYEERSFEDEFHHLQYSLTVVMEVFKNKLPSSLPVSNDVLIQLLSMMENMPDEFSRGPDIEDFIKRIQPKLLVDLKELKVQVERHISEYDDVIRSLRGIQSKETLTLDDVVHTLQEQEQNMEQMKNTVLKLKLNLEEMIATSEIKPVITLPSSASLEYSGEYPKMYRKAFTTLDPQQSRYRKRPLLSSASLEHPEEFPKKSKSDVLATKSPVQKLPSGSGQTQLAEKEHEEVEMKSEVPEPM